MVDVSNQHWNEDGSITIILNSIEQVEEIVELIKPTVNVIDVIKPIYNFKAKL